MGRSSGSLADAVRRAAGRLPVPPRRVLRVVSAAAVPVASLTTVGAAAFAVWWLLPDTVAGWVGWVAPLVAVAAARALDVTLGTVRTVFVVMGRQWLAAVAATLEAAVWLTAAGFVLRGEFTVASATAYSLGVGAGTLIGISIVRAGAWGLVTVRVFTSMERGPEVAAWIRSRGNAATLFTGEGKDGPRAMILTVVRRRDANRIAADIDRQPGTFVMVDSGPAPGFQMFTTGRA